MLSINGKQTVRRQNEGEWRVFRKEEEKRGRERFACLNTGRHSGATVTLLSAKFSLLPAPECPNYSVQYPTYED